MRDCLICCIAFNGIRLEFKCEFGCGGCCRKCYATYILSGNNFDCMFCRKPQAFEHIHKNALTAKKTFVRDAYVNHLLTKDSELFKVTNIKFTTTKFKSLYNVVLQTGSVCEPYISELYGRKYSERFSKKVIIMDSLGVDIIKTKRAEAASKYIQPCACSQSGVMVALMLPTDLEFSEYYCTWCNNTFCSKCKQANKGEHECSKQILEDIELLDKTTKACPCCSVRCVKVEGCSQVRCGQCGFLFDYNDLSLVETIDHTRDNRFLIYDTIKENTKRQVEFRDVIMAPIVETGDLYYALGFKYCIHEKLRTVLNTPAIIVRCVAFIIKNYLSEFHVGYEDRCDRIWKDRSYLTKEKKKAVETPAYGRKLVKKYTSMLYIKRTLPVLADAYVDACNRVKTMCAWVRENTPSPHTMLTTTEMDSLAEELGDVPDKIYLALGKKEISIRMTHEYTYDLNGWL